MVRILLGFVLLVIAATLLGYAGGIDMLSTSAVQNIANQWTLPSKDENERSIVLLLAVLVALLAIVRLITPRTSSRLTPKA